VARPALGFSGHPASETADFAGWFTCRYGPRADTIIISVDRRSMLCAYKAISAANPKEGSKCRWDWESVEGTVNPGSLIIPAGGLNDGPIF